MASEPVEVEVLNEDGSLAVRPKRQSVLMVPIKALAFVFAVLTALMILLVGIAGVLLQQSEPPKKPEE